MIVDSNTHPTLNGLWLKNQPGITCYQLSEILREAKVDYALAIGLPGIGGYSHGDYWDECKNFSNLIPIAAVTSRRRSELESELRTIKDIGYKAIKFHPRLLDVPELSSFAELLFSLAAQFNFILFVCGYVYRDIEEYNVELADFHKTVLVNMQRNKNLQVVYLHGGIHSLTEMLMWSRHSKNLLVDLSGTFQYRQKFLREETIFMIDKLDLRITVGSDFPDLPYVEYTEAIRELRSINAEKSKHVLGGNISRVLNCF